MHRNFSRSLLTNSLRATATLAFAAILLALCASTAHAQFRANLQGTVTDPTGAVVTGATVTLISNETQRTQTTTTNDEGFYRFSSLAPGSYSIAVEQTGFSRANIEDYAVAAEETQGLDFTLTTGSVTETVQVTGTATQALETENANISRAITETEIRQLPQVGRDPYELARLTPGVFGQGARGAGGGAVELPGQVGPGGSDQSIFQTENQVPITANGQRVSGNNFQIDGTSVNSLQWGGAAVVTPNQESVKEVRIIANNYSAEFGRNSGAQILTTSQNGTNDFHGSAVFKYNDPKLNAFNRYNGINNPPVRVANRFRQFGGSLGGPIYLPRFGEGGPAFFSGKNRLFFFVSYEGLRNNANNFGTGYVETSQYRQLIQQVRPNSVAAQVFRTPGIEPRVSAVIPVGCSNLFGSGTQPCQAVTGGLDIGSPAGAVGQFTSPSGAGLDGIPDLQFVQYAIPSTERGNQFNGRIDYTRGNDTIAVSGYLTRRNDLRSDASSRSRPIGDLVSKPVNTYGSIIYNRVIGATTVNEARFNATRFAFDEISSSTITNFGIPRIEVEGYPTDRVRFGAPQGAATPGVFAQNTFEFRDTLRTVVGNHALSFGGEIRREQDNNNLAGNARPAYSFVGLFNLANDAPVFQFIAVDPVTGGRPQTQRYFRTATYAGFAQDDWKLRPNLTINLGLRYEYFSPITEKEGRLFNLQLGGANGISGARLAQVDQFYEPDRNNFAPRVAFAYSPNFGGFGGLLSQDRAVIRGGFGIAYNRVANVIFSNSRNNPPLIGDRGLCCAFSPQDLQNLGIRFAVGPDRSPFGYPTAPGLAGGVAPGTNFVPGATVFAAFDVPTPYVYSYSLEMQNDLPGGFTSSLAYQGSASRKLVRTVPQQFLFQYETGSFINGLGSIFVPRADVNANYNALVARLTKRLSYGLSFDTNYRFSKSIDTVSGEFGAATNQTYPVDQSTERGPSDFDVRHTFVLSGVYELPIFRDRRGVAGALLGGFSLNPIITANSGFPWTPRSGRGVNTPAGFFGPLRPVAYTGGALQDTSNAAFIRQGGNFPFQSSGANGCSAITPGLCYFTPPPEGQSDFRNVRPGIGRNVFRGPRYFSTDLSVVKQTAMPFLGLGERANLDIRANFFNLFNQTNLAAIPEVFIDSPNFGRATGGLSGRVVEFQARFSF
jgi:hypothetical protein